MAKPVQNNSVKNTRAKQGFIEKNALKIAISLGVIGLILRLYRLGFLSLWVDEYMHALAAMKGHFSHGENNGILLTWINTSLAFVFGHSEFMLRFPVALLGAALVPAVYVLGRDVSNYKVGLMAAVFTTFSLYLMFWSRVDRPYGMVATFYVPLLVSFWLMMERPSGKDDMISRIGVNKKYILYVIIAFVLAMLSQLICFLFIFTAGFYGMMVAVDNWITKKSSPLKFDMYNLLFYLNVVAIFLMFTPWGSKLMGQLLELFLPKNIATVIRPDLKNMMTVLSGDKWDNCFNSYLGVLSTDFKLMNILGWSGFVFALIKNRKMGYFLIASFVIPFLLMSFVFTNISHAKYMIQLYPVFLISSAYSLYFIAFNLLKFLDKKFFLETNATYLKVCTAGFLILAFIITPRKDITKMLTTEKHGTLVSSKLAEISYVNWKQPCTFLNDNRKEGDVIMATVQVAPRYYLNLDSVVWFRQMHLNPKWSITTKTEEKYIQNAPENKKLSANSYDELVKTYQNNPRGWLLADYYFDNAMTDPRAKEFVEQNFTYHFDACDDGAVKVFSWDKAKPRTYDGSFVIELGKNDNQEASQPFTISINKATLPPKVTLYFLTQGIDSEDEAYIVINGEKQVAIKPNGRPSEIASNLVPVDASYFKNGENKIQFVYNTDEINGDMRKGFVIYNMDLR